MTAKRFTAKKQDPLPPIEFEIELIDGDESRIDIWYIENWSLALDLYILLKTPFAVLNRKGAY